MKPERDGVADCFICVCFFNGNDMKEKEYGDIPKRVLFFAVVTVVAVAGTMLSFLTGCGGSCNRNVHEETIEEVIEESKAPYRVVDCPTPNKGEGVNSVEGIVLHHTAEDSIEKSIRILTSPAKGVSCHVLIDKDGTRYVMANPEEVTWHAGFSRFNGKDGANATTVGIEFQGNTLEEPLTDDQINSAIEYVLPIMEKYNIPIDRIVTHEKIREDYKKSHPKSKVPDKHDVTPDEYSRFIEALKAYYSHSIVAGGLEEMS